MLAGQVLEPDGLQRLGHLVLPAVAAPQQGERAAADLRDRMNADPQVDPADLFAHVYARPTPQLREQAEMVAAEREASRPETEEVARR